MNWQSLAWSRHPLQKINRFGTSDSDPSGTIRGTCIRNSSSLFLRRFHVIDLNVDNAVTPFNVRNDLPLCFEVAVQERSPYGVRGKLQRKAMVKSSPWFMVALKSMYWLFSIERVVKGIVSPRAVTRSMVAPGGSNWEIWAWDCGVSTWI